jgi:hypothetical protein
MTAFLLPSLLLARIGDDWREERERERVKREWKITLQEGKREWRRERVLTQQP